jgi:23S rRNA pseudouridine1911/1915/1917 synthase
MDARPGQDYRVLERLRGSTFVEALLHTGRTHQIRVHFLHLGFPLVGGSVYGKRQNKHLAEGFGYSAPRQMLHAQKLVFRHPRTKRQQTFQAPLPDDFKDALAAFWR